jgi:3-oxoacyl-[acyl-carrier protein] reductase
MRSADRGADAAGAVPKALRVLETVAGRKRPLAIAEIAAALDLSQPTAHRIVTSLERLGFLGREPGRRRIVEGRRLVGLGMSVLQAAAGSGARHAILTALARKTGESCNLGVVAGTNVVYIDRVESQWPLGLRFEPGSRVPLHCTAIGKLMLSQLPEGELEAQLGGHALTRYTATTITDLRRLKAELARIRRQGYSTDNQEFMSGVVCIAVPVKGPRNGQQACAGLAISAAEARLTLAAPRRQPERRLNSMDSLKGKSVLVTGAARGLGAALAAKFSAAGANVLAADITADAKIKMDVTDRIQIKEILKKIGRDHGGLDILVNNAGLLASGPAADTSGEAWDKLLAVNVTGVFNCVQAAVPVMRGRAGASILNIASVSHEKGGGAIGNVWYGTTKAAVVAMTRGLARELGPDGIRVNAIAPAVLETDMVRGQLTPELRARVVSRIPLGRLAGADDIARLALFLCSEEASFITGETVAVDGGFLRT